MTIVRVEAVFDEKEVARCAFCAGHFAEQIEPWANGAIRIPGARPCSHNRPRLEMVLLRSARIDFEEDLDHRARETRDADSVHTQLPIKRRLLGRWGGAWYFAGVVKD